MRNELEIFELVLLFKFTATPEGLTDRIEFYRDFLIEKGCQVMVKNHGKISLAYSIKDCDSATSVQVVFLGNGEVIKQINTEIQRDTTVLRSLITRVKDSNGMNVFYP